MTQTTPTPTLSDIAPLLPQLVALRRQIHQHPEIGFEEWQTAQLIADTLRTWGIEVTTGIGGTGVVASVKGRYPGKGALGLRADMDTLYIREQTGLPYASSHPGKMHACGHDGHVAMLLGNGDTAALHTPHYDFNDAIIPVGIQYWASLVYQELARA